MMLIGCVASLVVISLFLFWLLLMCSYVRVYGTGPPASAQPEGCLEVHNRRCCSPAPTASPEVDPQTVLPPPAAALDGSAKVEPTQEAEVFSAVPVGGHDSEAATAAVSDADGQDAEAWSLRVISEKEAATLVEAAPAPALNPHVVEQAAATPCTAKLGHQGEEEVIADTAAATDLSAGWLSMDKCASEANEPLPKAPLAPVQLDGPASTAPQEQPLTPSQIVCFDFPICMPCVTRRSAHAPPPEEEMVYISNSNSNPL